MGVLVVNFKNYPEILGEGSVALARAVGEAGIAAGVKVIVAPPSPMLALVASATGAETYSQAVDDETGGQTTGAVLPEAVRGAGARGTILNHSESRVPAGTIRVLVPRLKKLGLEVCLCAKTAPEAAALSGLGTGYLAIEPPELIGTGISVSRARPGLVEKTVEAARRTGYRGKVLCGAGIVGGEDVKKALELGAEGVLVSSSVVKAKDWRSKLDELARSLI
jgi:triosephosphate isomerase (TIM)